MKLFKYEYLSRSIDKLVYGTSTMSVESLIPYSQRSYFEKNLKFSGAYGQFNARIPTYLYKPSLQFVKHCLNSSFTACRSLRLTSLL